MAASAGVIIGWPGAAAIPAGWSRYTDLDGRIPHPQSTGILATGGSDTHTHTLNPVTHNHADVHEHLSGGNTGTVAGNGVFTRNDGSQYSNYVGIPHAHAADFGVPSPTLTSSDATPTPSSGNNNIATYTVRWIKADGTTDIPIGAVAWTNQSTLPTGWQAHAASVNYYLRGAAAAANGGTATPAATHTHTASHGHNHSTVAHSHPMTLSTAFEGNSTVAQAGALVAPFAGDHVHTISGTHGSTSHTGAAASNSAASSTATPDLSYYKLRHIEATSAVAVPFGLIALFESVTPPGGGWATCNGSNGTPAIMGSGRYVKGANGAGEIGNVGGGTSHSHTYSHTHTNASSLANVHGAGSLVINNAGPYGNRTGLEAGGLEHRADTHSHALPTILANITGPLSSKAVPYVALSFDPPYQLLNFIMKTAAPQVTVAGNQPSASGVLLYGSHTSTTATGSQPAATGTVTAHYQFQHKSLAGNQPAASGAVSGIKGRYITLAGNQPSGSSSIAAIWTLRAVLVEGWQPWPTGSLFAGVHAVDRVVLPAGRVQGLKNLPPGKVRAVRPGR